MLALTFDDGPDPRGTPGVLDALNASGVRATFFVLAERVEEHAELLERVRSAGHDVQVHGYGHLRHPLTPRGEIVADLERALDILVRAGVRPTRWRIPWGDLAEFTHDVARDHALEPIGWTTDTHDWRGDQAQAMLDGLTFEPGAIVLAHDGIGTGATRTDARETVALIGPLVAKARALGLEPGPLSRPWPVPIPAGNPDFG